MKIAFLDTETLRLASEVKGGWGNPGGMGLACLCFKVSENVAQIYIPDIEARAVLSGRCADICLAESGRAEFIKTSKEAQNLLDACDLIVGFNSVKFDYAVLEGAGFKTSDWIPKSYDILQEFYSKMGFRVSLDNMAQATIGESKISEGIQAVEDWNDGLNLISESLRIPVKEKWVMNKIRGAYYECAKILLKEVIDYCVDDVNVTARLFLHIVQTEGAVRYWDKRTRQRKTVLLRIPQ